MVRSSVAGDFDYETHGAGYARVRRTDPRIAAMVHEALGDARTVLNVGAGAGSYEPEDRYVLAIEPSASMRSQRPAPLVPAVDAAAENLPLDDQSVDASMAMVTIHQWSDLDKGLSELRRVTRGPIVVLTFDGDALDKFWLNHYAPEGIEVERGRYPKIDALCSKLGGTTEVVSVPIPIDCLDGFTEAFYARPEMFLEPSVRRSQSSWGFLAPGVEDRFAEHLQSDLASGEWDRRFGEWRSWPTYDGSLRLVISRDH